MCGIVGCWNFDEKPVDQGTLLRFTDSLAHRGPDGRGMYIDSEACLGLGHRRLAILDTTSRGGQPMVSSDNRFYIVYNGEIYNFLELRLELEALGQTFRTETDTEVVLAAYLQWGEGCFLRFNGMWAMAIWDSRERTLLLCRDRFGVKPLHFWRQGDRFAFASEMRAFAALEGFPLAVAPENFSLAITRPSFFEGTENCILAGVKRLPGGYRLKVFSDGHIEQRRWWNTLDHLEEPPVTYEEQVERFRELFMDACRIRMRSDVPIGTSLSGGLDSSSVLAAVCRLGGQNGDRAAPSWQKAFIARYIGTSHDETTYADAMVEYTGAEPFYFEVTPRTLAEYGEEVASQYGELSDIHVGPWLAYRLQRKSGVVVSLDGHGGDELLAGYHRYHHPLMADAALSPAGGNGKFAQLRASLESMFEPGHPSYVPDALVLVERRRDAGTPLHEVYPEPSLRIGPHPWLNAMGTVPVLPQLEEDKDRLLEFDSLFVNLYIDYHCVELPTNLRDYDRLSMAHGVEVRSPLCDWRLACYAFSLPSSCKIGNGYAKRILRDATKGMMPEAIRLRRTKVGFANPRAEWRQLLKPLVMDTVCSRRFLESSLWKGKTIARAVEQGYARGYNMDVDRSFIFVQASLLLEALGAST
nr:asparagine synthase (glutamine-hydrolyzing) [Salidesulfovibrio onnuriiensis]